MRFDRSQRSLRKTRGQSYHKSQEKRSKLSVVPNASGIGSHVIYLPSKQIPALDL